MGKKRKSYFNKDNANKKAKLKFGNTIKLAPNMKGFLITYNSKFTFVVNEARKIIQQFASNLAENQNSPEESCSGDIEKMLKQELDTLNEHDKELKILDTGAKYTIFLNFESVNPNKIASSVYEVELVVLKSLSYIFLSCLIFTKHIEESQKPIGRYVQRFMPILNTCKAHLDDIEKCVKQSLDAYFENNASLEKLNNGFKYCCIFKASNNGSISKEEIFKMAGNYLTSKNKSNKVDFDQPDYVLYIQVICNICFISFVDNYFKYRKYNLIEMGCKFTNSKSISASNPINKSDDTNQTTNAANQIIDAVASLV